MRTLIFRVDFNEQILEVAQLVAKVEDARDDGTPVDTEWAFISSTRLVADFQVDFNESSQVEAGADIYASTTN